ncbi:MAG TPA: hypothetical protein VGB83_05550 [Actinomycetota bacterium]
MLTRREFILAGSLAVLGACARKPAPPATTTLNDVIANRTQGVQVIWVQVELLSGRTERLPFALIGADGPINGATGRFWIARNRESEALGPYDFRHVGGELGERGLYVGEVSVPEDGLWLLAVEATPPGGATPALGVAQIQAGATNQMPKPGDAAVSVATPTTRKHRGVDPICTRRPPCGMHETSLDDALAAGSPVVLTIGTPRFCQSATCGPVVDVLEGVRDEFPGVTFVHAELLRDDHDDTVAAYAGQRPSDYEGSPIAPAAVAWNVTEEPATYYIGADGTIVERHLSGIDEVDARAAIAALT